MKTLTSVAPLALRAVNLTSVVPLALRAALLLTMVVPLALRAANANITVSLADFSITPLSNQVIYLTPVDIPTISSPSLLALAKKVRTTDAAGQTTFSNVIAGTYTLGLPGSLNPRIIVPTTSSTLNAADLVYTATSPSTLLIRTNGVTAWTGRFRGPVILTLTTNL
jgi:hypothetical protein